MKLKIKTGLSSPNSTAYKQAKRLKSCKKQMRWIGMMADRYDFKRRRGGGGRCIVADWHDG